jgi:hypothetical protein
VELLKRTFALRKNPVETLYRPFFQKKRLLRREKGGRRRSAGLFSIKKGRRDLFAGL